MNLRIKQAYLALEEKNLDALLVSSCANISYLTQSISRDAYLVVCPKANTYFTDSRYTAEAETTLKNFGIKNINGSFAKTIASACKELGIKQLGFEERNLSFAEYAKIKQGLGGGIKFIPTHSLIETLRETKTGQELGKIRRAARISLAAFDFVQKIIRPGLAELEICGEIQRFIRYQGAGSSAFEIIVACSANSSFPHHITGKKKLENNTPVLIDLGVDYLGYKSDLTRVFFLGKMSVRVKEIFSIVKEAQRAAIKRVKPGITTGEIDRAARQFIAQKGYGEFFVHSTGHGVGLQVHEEPHITKGDNAVLKENMVFTIEPGIYLPQEFGIRIEDMVYVTKQGGELISGTVN